MQSLRGSRITALADTDERRLADAHRFAPQAATHTDYVQLLDQTTVDAVFICLPTDLHAVAAQAALCAGKHVYLEKPIASNLDEARLVLETARRGDVITMIGFNYRYNPIYTAVRRHITGTIWFGLNAHDPLSTHY